MTERRKAALDAVQLPLALEGRSSPELKTALVTLMKERRRAALPDETAEVTLRVPASVADAVAKDPEGAARHLQSEAAQFGITVLAVGNGASDSGTGAYDPNKPLEVNKEAFMRPERGTVPADYVAPPRDADEPFTRWSRGVPPSSGFWQVKQHSARSEKLLRNAQRFWYSEFRNDWHNPAPYQKSEERLAQKPIPHEQFMKSHEWRGLREKPSEPYPYDLHEVKTGL